MYPEVKITTTVHKEINYIIVIINHLLDTTHDQEWNHVLSLTLFANTAHQSKEADHSHNTIEETNGNQHTAESPQPADKLEREMVGLLISKGSYN